MTLESTDLSAITTPIDEAIARALLEPSADAWDAAEAASGIDGAIDFTCWASGGGILHEGDLVLDELTLAPESESLFVRGNLTVRGVIQQAFRAGFLVVLGDLRAGAISTCAQIVVTGDLVVAGTIYGNCTNYMTSVLGTTRAQVLVSAKEHLFCMYGGHEVATIVDVYGSTPNLDDRAGGDELLSMDECYDELEAAARLRRGESLLR